MYESITYRSINLTADYIKGLHLSPNIPSPSDPIICPARFGQIGNTVLFIVPRFPLYIEFVQLYIKLYIMQTSIFKLCTTFIVFWWDTFELELASAFKGMSPIFFSHPKSYFFL